MRHVYEHQGEARSRGKLAGEHVRRVHSPLVAGRMIRARLQEIRRERLIGGPMPWIEPPPPPPVGANREPAAEFSKAR
jgi:hypothetical protein